MIGAAIGLAASKWLAQVPDGGASQQEGSSGAVLSALLAAGSGANASIGHRHHRGGPRRRGSRSRPARTTRARTTGGLKILAFQAADQSCGYLPDSDATHFDKINVRQGRYDIWGPIHLVTAVDDSGNPTNAQAPTILNTAHGERDERHARSRPSSRRTRTPTSFRSARCRCRARAEVSPVDRRRHGFVPAARGVRLLLREPEERRHRPIRSTARPVRRTPIARRPLPTPSAISASARLSDELPKLGLRLATFALVALSAGVTAYGCSSEQQQQQPRAEHPRRRRYGLDGQQQQQQQRQQLRLVERPRMRLQRRRRAGHRHRELHVRRVGLQLLLHGAAGRAGPAQRVRARDGELHPVHRHRPHASDALTESCRCSTPDPGARRSCWPPPCSSRARRRARRRRRLRPPLRPTPAANPTASDVTELRDEVKALRADLEEIRGEPRPAPMVPPPLREAARLRVLLALGRAARGHLASAGTCSRSTRRTRTRRTSSRRPGRCSTRIASRSGARACTSSASGSTRRSPSSSTRNTTNGPQVDLRKAEASLQYRPDRARPPIADGDARPLRHALRLRARRVAAHPLLHGAVAGLARVLPGRARPGLAPRRGARLLPLDDRGAERRAAGRGAPASGSRIPTRRKDVVFRFGFDTQPLPRPAASPPTSRRSAGGAFTRARPRRRPRSSGTTSTRTASIEPYELIGGPGAIGDAVAELRPLGGRRRPARELPSRGSASRRSTASSPSRRTSTAGSTSPIRSSPASISARSATTSASSRR